MPPFSLPMSHPYELLLLSTMGNQPISHYMNTLLIVKEGEYEDGCDVLELLDDSADQVCMHSICDP